MEKLIIKETLNSPGIILDPSKGRFEISGKSFPENARAFYQPLIDWITKIPATQEKLRLSVILDYISSSSVISLKQVLTKVKSQQQNGVNLEVLWHFDPTDPDMKEIGEELEKVVGMKLTFVPRQV